VPRHVLAYHRQGRGVEVPDLPPLRVPVVHSYLSAVSTGSCGDGDVVKLLVAV